MEVPTAPATGLFLDKCFYDHYNSVNKQYQKISFDNSPIKERVDEFKKVYIYDHIIKQEDELHSFTLWINEIVNNPLSFTLREIDETTLASYKQRTQQTNKNIRERGIKRRVDMRYDKNPSVKKPNTKDDLVE